MSPHKARQRLVCDACGAPVRRGKYRLCLAGCGARLHTDHRSACTDAHAPVCPRYTWPAYEEGQTRYPGCDAG